MAKRKDKKKLVSCDECGKQFTIKKLIETKVKDDIVRSYFKCPHCGHEYTVTYADDNFRENIKRIIAIGEFLKEFNLKSSKIKVTENVRTLKIMTAKKYLEEQQNLIKQNKIISNGYRSMFENK